MSDCIVCGVMDALDTAILGASVSTYAALDGPMKLTMDAFLAVSWLWQFVRMCTDGFDIKEAWGRLLIAAVATFFLSAPGLFQEWIYDPTRSFIYGVAGITLAAGSGDASSSFSLSGMAKVVEDNFVVVTNLGMSIFRDGRLRPDYWIAALLLMIPWFAQLLLFCVILLYALALMNLPFALAPIFIVAGVFKPSRKVLTGGVDMLVASGCYIIISSMIVGMLATAASDAITALPSVDSSSWTGSDATSNFLTSSAFWTAVILGWIGLYWLLKVGSLVSYITNKADQIFGSLPRLPRPSGQ